MLSEKGPCESSRIHGLSVHAASPTMSGCLCVREAVGQRAADAHSTLMQAQRAHGKANAAPSQSLQCWVWCFGRRGHSKDTRHSITITCCERWDPAPDVWALAKHKPRPSMSSPPSLAFYRAGTRDPRVMSAPTMGRMSCRSHDAYACFARRGIVDLLHAHLHHTHSASLAAHVWTQSAGRCFCQEQLQVRLRRPEPWNRIPTSRMLSWSHHATPAGNGGFGIA